MCGTKRLNQCFRLPEVSDVRYFSFSPGLSFMGVGRGASPPLDFEIRHFYITFFSKKSRFLGFEKEKWNFIKFDPHWKNFYGWKNPLMAPPHTKFFRRPYSCCFLWVRYGEKTRLPCTVAKAADIQWSKKLTLCNTACVNLGYSLTSVVLQQSWAIPFYTSMHRKRF